MLATTLEKLLVERLQGYLEDVDVLPYPNKPDGYYLKHAVGEVLVKYSGSEFENPAFGNSQDAELNIDIVLVFRDLNSESGSIYAYLHKIKQSLMGWNCDLCGSFRVQKEEILVYDNGIWQASIVAKAKYVEVIEEQDEVLGILEEVITD